MWHAKRFIPDPEKIQAECVACGKSMWFPSCKAGKYLTCSPECRKEKGRIARASRKRNCLVCASEFVPRMGQISNAQGKYCSVACSVTVLACSRTAESSAKAAMTKAERSAQAAAEGKRYNHHYKGDENPKWKGGPKATVRRQIESGRAAAWNKAWRDKNPDLVSEREARRRGAKKAERRLGPGTISRIFEAQKGKCAICKTCVKKKRHVDHIQPIAKGGKHIAENLQILCPSCNVRKSAKDPIAYMQELGFLL